MQIFSYIKNESALYPEKIAIRNLNEAITYKDLIIKVEELARDIKLKIQSIGLNKVAVIAKNGIEEVILLLAASQLNIKILLINPELTEVQRNILMKSCGINYAFIPANPLGNYYKKNGISSCYWSFKKIYNVQGSTKDGLSEGDFLITGSSGSTGTPKPLVFSQTTKYLRMMQSKNLYNIGNKDVILNASPIFHSLGQRLTFLPLMNGAELVILNKFSAKAWIEIVLKQKITATIAVSTHLQSVVSKVINGDLKDSSLRLLVSSSAGINNETKRLLFKNESIEFHEQYGASEVATVTNCDKNLFLKSPESIGKACSGVEIMIRGSMDENVGQVSVKSPLVCSGIMQEGKLARIDSESFVEIGDLGLINDDNFFFLKGRTKEVINVGGQNVYPLDIIKKLQELKEINECVIFGVQDNYFGEKPIAIITLKFGYRISKSALISWCLQNMPNFQRPHDFIIREELLKLPSGKYDVAGMKESYLNQEHIKK